METETKRTAEELSESISKSVKQAIRVANGENLGIGAEKWLAGLQKEAGEMKDGNRII